ncbi:hypothetical protein [Chromobacterium sp. IIBBL 290-4]|uniref:hypothetical protein n=1 Tax=Chromobacterium sp. IIBBL 290-4 TaxID=2953890 RepID=UPI0020B8D5CF|nr:hypothetical protein [Chromobacterium sp. IIBBL 290-4]UTH76396.1 hypothetical protein NKT35_09940 [Chromobacterium sp. IIBBL 290-4]
MMRKKAALTLWGSLLLSCFVSQAEPIPIRDPYFAQARAAWPPPTRELRDKSFELIDTGLEGTYHDIRPKLGEWLDNDHLIVNAVQPGWHMQQKGQFQIMLVDARTGKSSVLLPHAMLQCWNAKRQLASIRPIPAELPPGRRVWDLENFLVMHLGSDGLLTRLSALQPFEPITCEATDNDLPLLKDGYGRPLQDIDGFLQWGLPKQSFQSNFNTVLMRRGQPPKQIGVRAGEVFSPIYLPYLKRYLLNSGDSQHDSATDRRLAGATWGDRPYDLTPYRLMSADGEVTEIPYPKIIFSYGVHGFSDLLPTPQGLLLDSSGRSSPGLLLLKGEQLYRIWGGQRWFAPGWRESAYGLKVSPDGCRLAFIHASTWSVDSSNEISILNLCKENNK